MISSIRFGNQASVKASAAEAPDQGLYDLLQVVDDKIASGDTAGARQIVKDTLELQGKGVTLKPRLDAGDILKRAKNKKQELATVREQVQEDKLSEAHKEMLDKLRKFLKKETSSQKLDALSGREFLEILYAHITRRPGFLHRVTLGQHEARQFRDHTLLKKRFDLTQKDQADSMLDELRDIAQGEMERRYLDRAGYKYIVSETMFNMIEKVLKEQV
jgi:hypothetical protein